MLAAAHAAYWAALASCGSATVVFAIGTVFRKSLVMKLGGVVTAAAFVMLTVALALRWSATGHGPYLGRHEALASYSWALIGFYLLLQWRIFRARAAGLIVAPTSFFMLGVAALSPAAAQFESPAMRSTWLWVHVGMAKVAVASLLLAAGISALSLRRSLARPRRLTGPSGPGAQESGLEQVEELSVRLVSLGFLVLAVVIGAGALWANTAWGSYWSWDPIETWSLATWVLYGMALHLYHQWHVTGVRWAWLNVSVLAVAAMLLLALWVLSLSPHWIYLS